MWMLMLKNPHDDGSTLIELCADRYSLDMEASLRGLHIHTVFTDGQIWYHYKPQTRTQYYAEYRKVKKWKDDTDDWKEFTESLY